MASRGRGQDRPGTQVWQTYERIETGIGGGECEEMEKKDRTWGMRIEIKLISSDAVAIGQ
jgi:hypothetical protein